MIVRGTVGALVLGTAVIALFAEEAPGAGGQESSRGRWARQWQLFPVRALGSATAGNGTTVVFRRTRQNAVM